MFVVMVIILFGFVGMIWGYNYWDVLLLMFMVVGFLGMMGIIINDLIVLVIMIDEYVKECGFILLIIEGIVDCLWLVMLIILIIVFGLILLLFECLV